MSSVRLGKLALYWCDECNLPVLGKKCSICSSNTRAVKHTPPGDVRPAFDPDLEDIRTIIDDQFGNGCGLWLLPRDCVILLNRIPDRDRMEEVIIGGLVVGNYQYVLGTGYRFILKLEGAWRLASMEQTSLSQSKQSQLQTASDPQSTSPSHSISQTESYPQSTSPSHSISQTESGPQSTSPSHSISQTESYPQSTAHSKIPDKQPGRRPSIGWVLVEDGAAVFMKSGNSVLAPGVIDADPGIQPGSEVMVISESGEVIGTGSARMSGSEMAREKRGLCVRLRQKWRPPELPSYFDKKGSRDDAVKASMNTLVNHEKEAGGFIHRIIEQHHDLPVMVSLSGGKDSLAVLHLVLAAGIRPGLLFLNTGLEFPETIENVHRTAEKFDLDLVIGDADDAFWSGIDHFGPPSRDYRWCCKLCKMGPTTRTIMEQFPDGVLSFIGQRAYESMQRKKKPRIWVNPWVPGQVGASPIQYWTALHIWLYLFWKEADYNPLYETGLARIGCWLCPASDLADYERIRDVHPDRERWDQLLNDYAARKGFTEEWVEYDLWRWKNPPGFVKDLMKEKGIRFRINREQDKGLEQVGGEVQEKIQEKEGGHKKETEYGMENDEKKGMEDLGEENDIHLEPLSFMKSDAYASCTDEVTIEGVFTRPLNMGRLSNLLMIIGEPEYDPDTGVLAIGRWVTVTGEGSVSVKGNDSRSAGKGLDSVVEVIKRSEECVGCGICIGRCPNGALFLNDRKAIDINIDLCTSCRSCLGKCPVTDFIEDREFEI